MTAPEDGVEPIAVIGIACRVPGAHGPREFWRSMRDGTESIARFGRDELLAAGGAPDVVDDPDHVPASGHLPGADLFDADFFGFTPAEAETMDPQQRLFCESAWEVFEDAGYDPARVDGAVGVFAGMFLSKYFVSNLGTNRRFLRSAMAPLARMFTDKDFLATRVAHLLDLEGPACTVQTACSTSLVATHLACQSLLCFESDMALVGGVCVNMPLKAGYPVADRGLFSPTGHCRPFDVAADGTVPGNGVVTVLLRRLSDALGAGDHVYGLITGSAVNNDGALKAGYAAPSVAGQAKVVAAAHAMAGLDPSTLGYVEAHATATQVGDPIEVTALSQAFGTGATGYCALGSVKANIGHLDAAAGLAGLVRAVLAIRYATIPPSINFTAENPELRLASSPFYVPRTATGWTAPGPRRAAVSSFGVGGTNAHAVLEQAPDRPEPSPARPWQLVPVSARNAAELDEATGRVADALAAPDAPRLADAAFTLQTGRRAFGSRRFAVCTDAADAVRALRGVEPGRLTTRAAPAGRRTCVFAFPGGGTQPPDMGLDVYRSEEVFRREVDACAEILEPRLGYDLRRVLFPSAFAPLRGLRMTGGVMMGRDQGAGVVSSLFVVEYAMARQLESWGVRPIAMVGHSLGEYVAACLAGVFSLPDALEITLARGELFERMEPGTMLTVALPEDRVRELLPDRLSVAAVNAPALTVVAGPDAGVAAFRTALREQGVTCRRLAVPVASHSWMVEEHLPAFRERVSRLDLAGPRVPTISAVTGTWLTDEQATDPGYWARHLREPVRFGAAVRTALGRPDQVLVEVGPGKALSALAAAQDLAPLPVAVPTMGLARDALPDLANLVGAVGRLWQSNVEVDWDAFHGGSAARVPMPTYPFARRRHWVEPGERAARASEPVPAVVATPAPGPGPTGPDVPLSTFEQQVARVWCDLLGVDAVGGQEDFFDLGAHSLMVTQVTRELRRLGATNLTARDVMSAPTVADMARLLEAGIEGRPVTVPGGPDLAEEIVLDPTVTADGLDPAGDGPPRTVLLTGITGFVGAFLAAELLRRTEADVWCLVRAADVATAERRVHQALDGYGLATTGRDRLRIALGDLSRPGLGLDPDEYDRLASRVDAVYHCGAWVNFVRPYRALKATNVTGTQEVLRFATTTRLKPVHHVSTLAVLAGAVVAGARHVNEDDPLPPPVGHDTAYSQSKWVAEGLIGLARERGIPVSVYRAGAVLADSRSGAANVEDYVTKVVQGCVQLGSAPLRRYPLAVGTVDHTCRLLVELSLRPQARGRTFHVIDPEPLEWNDIFDRIREFGLPVESVPFDRWRETLTEHVERDGDGEDNALAPLMAMLGEIPDRDMPVMDTAGPRECLPPAVLAAPPLERGYFHQMLEFLVRARMLPDPLRAPTPR